MKNSISNCSKIRILTKILATGCALSMGLSYKLWFQERPFPTVAAFRLFPNFHHPYDYIIPATALAGLLGILLSRNPRYFLLIFLISSIVLGIQDLNRWQPWFYQYNCMFFVLVFFDYRCDDQKHQEAILTIFKVMIAAVYFWSGLQKLNPNFLADTFPWLMEPITNRLGEGSIAHFSFLGKAFPLLEAGTGILLLLQPVQRFAFYGILFMHGFILFSLGPLGHNYNFVVWPWNIVMMAAGFFLFFDEQPTSFMSIRKMLHYHSMKFIMALFVLMPILNFFNHWDSYLSHNLYSGNTANGVISISDSVYAKLPPQIQKYAYAEDSQQRISIKYWCMQELGVPPYPEQRNFEGVKNSIYSYAKDSTEVMLTFTPKLQVGQ